ncbi:hypothetical protein T07_2440 [Trichinella nelsoni]|uniref:Uncharacterized protein n=1 Tax=Trichinella nelsoni TaxID=6336 RepID=A0A0V0RIQ6_9BILA|nr:hypothetical protein T07_2440 [Trichinella nelsoni]
MRFKHVMSCIKSDTLGLKGVHVSITNLAVCRFELRALTQSVIYSPLLVGVFLSPRFCLDLWEKAVSKLIHWASKEYTFL